MFSILLECDMCHKKMQANYIFDINDNQHLWKKGWGSRIEKKLTTIRKDGNGKDMCGKCLLEMNNG